MRLIIVDDKKKVLKHMIELLGDLPDDIERIGLHCKTQDEEMDVSGDFTCHTAASLDELCKLSEERLGFQDDDHYLLDITLFGERQVYKEFTDYGSVEFAKFLRKKSIDKIKFYTQPYALSTNDFVREVPDWGKPLYRPDLSVKHAEEYEKKNFYKQIKEFCHV